MYDTARVWGHSRPSFLYRHPSVQFLDWFKNQNPFILPTRHAQWYCHGIDDEAHFMVSLQVAPVHPSRLHLEHIDPSSPIEKPFVLLPTLCRPPFPLIAHC